MTTTQSSATGNISPTISLTVISFTYRCSTCRIDTGYVCTGAPSACVFTASCGDGTRHTIEECDDGNNIPFDGCSPYCKIDTGFTCNTNTPNVCSEICGDGIDHLTFACDDGDNWNGDGCDLNCMHTHANPC